MMCSVSELSSSFFEAIDNDETLYLSHINIFQELLAPFISYHFLNDVELQFPEELASARPAEIPSFQILYSYGDKNAPQHSVGHFLCAYYNKVEIIIYDSLNHTFLHDHVRKCLKALYPFLFRTDDCFSKVKFADVQKQENAVDCGVFSIAFAVSLFFNQNPEFIRYDNTVVYDNLIQRNIKKMRLHLRNIFVCKNITHFPYRPLQITPKTADYECSQEYRKVYNKEKYIMNRESILQKTKENYSMTCNEAYKQKKRVVQKIL